MSQSPTHHGEDAAALMRMAGIASVCVALLLVGLKVLATVQTDSMAMLGSLVDSTLDVCASIITLLAVRIAGQPADANHRFGHGKAEAISALFQTLMISVSAILLAVESGQRLFDPRPVQAPEMGIAVSIAAIALTVGLVLFQNRVVRQTGSVAIRTDQLHYKSDLLLNLSVIAALVLAGVLGIFGADAIMGLAIAGYLGFGAWRSANQAVDMLMDKEWPDAARDGVAALAKSVPGVVGVHELRTRTAGLHEFVQLHIWVDGSMSVRDGHRIADQVETQIKAAHPRADVIVHVDPAGLTETGERGIDHSPLDESPKP
jgi:ferrous-iron efflux pump FieF